MTSTRFLPLLLVIGPTTLLAQQLPDARWVPWLGCWQAAETAERDVPLICVRPTADPLAVEVTTVTDAESAFSHELIADGRAHDVALDDCAGSQVASFSVDGRRVYLRSTLTCEEGQHRTTSGIWAMASPTAWLDAQAIRVDDELVPRVLRYYPAPRSRWPAGFLLTPEQVDAVSEARVLVATPMTLADVGEAATTVHPDALATFVIERNQPFDLTATALAKLDDAAVPDAVIDALVAVSYPQRFAVEREEARPVPPAAAPPAPVREPHPSPYRWRDYGYSEWGWCDGGCCSYGTYCDSYGSRTTGSYQRRYGTLVYGPYFSYAYGRLVIVDRTARPRGNAVAGRGYTRGGRPESSGNYARPRTGPAGSWAGSAGYASSGSRSGTSRATSAGYRRSGGSSWSGTSSSAAKAKHR